MSNEFAKRWFVLREDVLLCFEDIDYEKPSKSIPLINISATAHQNQEKSRKKYQKGPKNRENYYHFQIVTPFSIYWFASPYEHHRDLWVSRLYPLNPLVNEENNILHLIENQIVAENFHRMTKN